MPHVFPLAPMSPMIRNLTIALLILPLLLVGLGVLLGDRTLSWVALLMVLLYALVWLLARPQRFVVTDDRLVIQFPVWQRTVQRSAIAQVQSITKEQFEQQFGWAIRIGVGGLWGGFGWLWTQRRGLLEFYLSCTTHLVLIERREQMPLLITPESSEAFIALFR